VYFRYVERESGSALWRFRLCRILPSGNTVEHWHHPFRRCNQWSSQISRCVFYFDSLSNLFL